MKIKFTTRFFIFGILSWLGLASLAWAAADPSAAADKPWGEVKGRHFVVYYEAGADEDLAQTLARRAEEYYDKIGVDTGYARANKFWTWEERAKIFLFSTRESFLRNTGQPVWSGGYADRDSHTFRTKTIITFKQEQEFLDGLLPHEISHLILHDFIPRAGQIPVWFDEGVAQLQEKSKREMVRGMMRDLVLRKGEIPFNLFVRLDIRKERDPQKAGIFYAQSLSVVDYLRAQYGADAFGRLCRGLRDHRSFEEALSAAYPGVIENFSDLGKKWISSLNN